MIRVIAGGQKNKDWLREACVEYEKRLRKPFDVIWDFVDEADLEMKVVGLKANSFVVLLDERGEMLDSPTLAEKIENSFVSGREVVLVLGGAFGHFSEKICARANLTWSLSKLVFPHRICRLLVIEQIYRAQEISLGHSYHHA